MEIAINIIGSATVIFFIIRSITFYYIYFRSERNNFCKRDDAFSINFRSQYMFAGLFTKTEVTGRHSRLGKLSNTSLKLFYISVVTLFVALFSFAML